VASNPRGLVLGDDLDAHRLHLVELVVEGPGGVGRGESRETGPDVLLQGPGAGAAALNAAREHDSLARSRGPTNAAGSDLRWRGHDHLDAVLDGTRRIEQEDVLGARADVYGEDLHSHPHL